METRANFIAVGAFVVAAFIGLLAFVVWLSNWQAEREYQEYWIYFPGSVKGLRVGSSVTYRGITVGEVTSIGFPDDGSVANILVKTRIDDSAPIKSDTVASLEIQGLAGGALVMLKGGSDGEPMLAAKEGEPFPVIKSTRSQLDRLLEGAPALVEQVQELVGRATLVFGDDNQTAFSGILANLNTLSGTLAGQSESIESVIEDARVTLAELKVAAGSVQTVGAALERDLPVATGEAVAALKNIREGSADLDKFIQQATRTAKSFDGAADEARGLIKENRPAIRDFTGSTLYDTNAFLADLRVLIDNLNRLTTEVGRDPARFLFGGQQRGYETR